jgi:hypothetical protein
MGKRTFRVKGATPALLATNEMVKMSGSDENYVMTTTRGTSIAGPIAIGAGSAQMRFGALWTMNAESALMIPSTTATPTPVMMINFPVQYYTGMMQSCQSMMSISGF